ncbi:MAG: aromatic amino acid lyase [Mycobacterium sp.]|nr:aromatic amino acid lyase [Mycobacterium sp.]
MLRTAARTTQTLDLSIPGRLTCAMLEQAAQPVQVAISDEQLNLVALCRIFMLEQLAKGEQIYGATTGFGPLVTYSGRDNMADQCDNIVYHLLAGHGEDLPPRVVRATALIRLWSLAQGHSGASVQVLSALTAMLSTSFAPAVPRIGSLGASGDLIPLAHLTHALRGHGYAYVDGVRMPARDALVAANLNPVELDGRDGLALVNGTSLTTAAAGLALASLHRSHTVAMLLSAVLTDMLGSAPNFLSADLLQAFGHPAAAAAAAQMRGWLDGIVPTGNRPLQEPYSIRCTPQLLGAVGESLQHADTVVADDLNGVSDNPMFFHERGEVVHGGNFFGQPAAFAADLLSTGTIQMGNLAERQLDLLIDPHRNTGLAPMLSVEPGRKHGVQGIQLAATATVAAMRRAATPASVQSIPTNGHNQDVVPFGTQAALNALDLATELRWLHGSLALALRQAIHVGGRRPTAPACATVIDQLMDAIAPIDADRALDDDVQTAANLLDDIADEYNHEHPSAEDASPNNPTIRSLCDVEPEIPDDVTRRLT